MNFINKITSWYFSRNALPYWSVLFLDLLIVLAMGILAYILNHGMGVTLGVFYPLLGTMAVFTLCYCVGFKLLHTYSGVLRFSSFVDLWRLGVAMAVGLCLALIVQLVFDFKGNVSLIHLTAPDLLLGAFMAVAVMWTMRIWVKTLYDSSLRCRRNIRVFIYGVREGGVALAKSLNTNESTPYILEGFASDDMAGRHLLGHQVVSADATLVDNMQRKHATALLVPRYKSDALRDNVEMVNALIKAGIKILVFPDARELSDGETPDDSVSNLREVKVEDLLPREKIEVDMTAIGKLLKGKRILITGAAGSIGSEMVRQIAAYAPSELLLVDQAETPLHDIRLLMSREWPEIKAFTIVADIARRSRMEELFATHRPEYVFHAAAYKHVPMMEDNPSESVANNVEGTRIVADLALKYGTRKFVMVSTDKAVNPTNVMGCSKRICEIYVQSLDKAVKEGRVAGRTCFVTTRFGNVLGSNGSVIPLFAKQIKEGGPVTVTHPEIIRYFMLIPEACKLVLEAGTMGNGGEIFVFDMGEPVKIADLARRMISLSGASNIEIKFTGLRDGEKLYEEVLNDKEVTLPTFHEKIKIARVREYDYHMVCDEIDKLIGMCGHSCDMDIVGAMKRIVPEFRSQHSPYEILDVEPRSLN